MALPFAILMIDPRGRHVHTVERASLFWLADGLTKLDANLKPGWSLKVVQQVDGAAEELTTEQSAELVRHVRAIGATLPE